MGGGAVCSRAEEMVGGLERDVDIATKFSWKFITYSVLDCQGSVLVHVKPR